MPVKNVFMFAGQGSQYYGMGRELLSAHPVFERSMRATGTVFADMGIPGVFEEIYRSDRGPADTFGDIRFTHPAILMIELAMAETLRSEGIEPDCVLGASLGEFAAAAVAGVLDVEDLARSVVDQLGLLEPSCPRGGMVAVLASVDLYERCDELRGRFDMAAVNTDANFVLSGAVEDVPWLETWLNARRIMHQRLPVDYAFHSSRLDTMAEPYLTSLGRLTLRAPVVPFVSCETVGYITRFEPAHFWRLVRSPIRFQEAIRFLERQEGNLCYVDLGPSATMTNFVTHNLRPGSPSRTLAILDPFAPPGQVLDRIGGHAGRSGPAPRPAPAGMKSIQRGESMRVIIFPGQGSQARGMGADLFADVPALIAEADEILGYSIASLCRDDPHRQLDQTQFTQPALFVVNALTYLARQRAGDGAADYLAGHSLGEYNALLAAGVFDFGTGLRLVRERARLMAAAAGGAMAAVIGLAEDQVRAVLADSRHAAVDLANHNAPDQFILSGPREVIGAAEPAFMAAGARAYLPLRVSGAFHSRYMEPARREFERILADCELRPPATPVIANVTGRPYEPAQVLSTLAEQLVRPVLWERSIRYLLSQGVTAFDETGPGTVLTGLVQKIRKSTPAPSPSIPSPVPPPARAVPAVLANGRNPGAGPAGGPGRLSAETLGSAEFRAAYGLRYAYVCGAMYRGIASEELVIRAGHAGILAFFGTGGLDLDRIGIAIDRIRTELDGRPFGVNLVHSPTQPAVEDGTVALLLERGVDTVEASAFMKMTPALVRYRLSGLTKGVDGDVVIANRIIAKVSRPEVAESFLSPAPERLVGRLERDGLISPEQAALAAAVPMADDLCVEADSGGHTDRGDPLVLVPTMLRLRDRLRAEHGYATRVRVGAAGGIGTPEAAAAAFVLGADFILTGSINLCTAESGMSSAAKNMLEQINIQDTDYAPAGDMFELGAQVQVLKRGVFFSARARKLYDLYRRHESLDEIDAETRSLIETRYFRRSFEDVWHETRQFFAARDPGEIDKAEQNPKHKMALVFRWYFGYSQRAAMEGREESRVDFQVHCGPALGAFNQWVRGTPLERWPNRHVDQIAERMMRETAAYLQERFGVLAGSR
jgi:trans-AT polyketide synthase/acyltransferase/oxidoreductase domain-containing protein